MLAKESALLIQYQEAQYSVKQEQGMAATFYHCHFNAYARIVQTSSSDTTAKPSSQRISITIHVFVVLQTIEDELISLIETSGYPQMRHNDLHIGPF